MNEGTKTGIFWAVAVVMVGIAIFVAWPAGMDDAVGVRVGKPLFEEFKDPLAAASLKIVTFDETLGQLESFEVAKDRHTGVWSIPSRQGYPADANEQMQRAAMALLGLKILDVKTDKAEEHEEYGVLEPKVEQLRVGDEGVGRLVSIKDESGNSLASLIIGDKVRDIASHRYVRIPNQDPVYEVELDDSPLTTEFRQWIEDDLLQLSSFDVAGTKIRNYSASVAGTRGSEVAISQKRNYDANLILDDSNEWQLENLVVFDSQNTGQARSLLAGESLDTAKLNKLKNALDDLKIVNVVRKPEGMSADLKANKSLLDNNDAIRSLFSRGFYPMDSSGAEASDILAANGELIVDLKDGIEYVLRFGSVAGIEESDEADADDEESEADAGASRYLLVTTRVNEARIPPPELKVVPETLEELEEMLNPSSESEEEPAPGDVQDNPNVDPESEGAADSEEGPDTTAPAADNAAADNAAANSLSDDVSEADIAAEESGADDAGDDAAVSTEADAVEASAADVTAEDEAASEPAGEQDLEASDDSAADQESDPEGATRQDLDGGSSPSDVEAPENAPENAPAANDQPELTEEEQQERLEAEQEKIRKENQRLLDAWKEKRSAANGRIRELNSRFADWYYVIPESTYSDLQLDLDELITKAGEASTPDRSAEPPAGPRFFPPGIGGN